MKHWWEENKNISHLLTIVLLMVIVWLGTMIGATIFPIIKVFMIGILPFISGIIIAFLLNPFVDRLANILFKGNKKISVFVTVTMLLAIFVFVVFPVVQSLLENLSAILRYFNMATTNLTNIISTMDTEFKEHLISYIQTSGIDFTAKIMVWVNSVFNISVDTSVGWLNNITTTSMNLFLSLIIALFALLDYENIRNYFTTLFGKDKKLALKFMDGLEKQIFYYLKSLFLSFIISSIVFAIVLHILNVNNAWSFTIILNLLIILIPIIGPIIATVILALILIPISFPGALLGFCFLFIFIQFFLNVISPRIYAETLDLPNLLIILAFLIGSTLFGIAGAILAVPSLLIIMYTYDFIKCKENKREEEE